jgi:hypothetical protein
MYRVETVVSASGSYRLPGSHLLETMKIPTSSGRFRCFGPGWLATMPVFKPLERGSSTQAVEWPRGSRNASIATVHY